MKRQHEATGDGAGGPPPKEPRTAAVPPGAMTQRRAVPPGYLHDLLHSRHMMKTVGLRAPPAPSHPVRKPGPVVAVTNARLAPVPRPVLHPSAFARPQVHRPPAVPGHNLPLLFQVRKRFLQKKRRSERDRTPYQQHVGRPVGLLSMPEDVLLKMVCYLKHDDVKPLFQVCKQLHSTLREAIRFHFNYATPSRGAPAEGTSPALAAVAARRPDRRRAVTALADVMAHLRQRSQRAAAGPPPVPVPGNAPGSTHSARPRMLSFTPQATPMSRLGSPQLARQLLITPGGTPAGPSQPKRTPLSLLAAIGSCNAAASASAAPTPHI